MNRMNVSVDRPVFCSFSKWLCQQGFTLEEIAGFTGLEMLRIRQLLEESGVPLKTMYESVTVDVVKAALADYTSGMHPLELKAKYGYSIREFRDMATMMDEAKIPDYEELDNTGRLFRQKRAWAMRKAGKKYQEIQTELGMNTKQAVGSLISGYESHLKKIEKTLNEKTVNGLYAVAVLNQISEIVNTDSDTAIQRIRAILGMELE